MEYSSFLKLCSIISPQVQVNDEMSRRRSGKDSMSVEIMLNFLIWLAGGSYLDIKLSAAISKAAFYSYIYKGMDAILDAEALEYKLPSTTKELDEATQGFELSSHGKGWVACLDGFLLQNKVPSKSDTGNVKAYFSGHYQTDGINVQAACDHKCRFVYAALAVPGGANDIAAFKKTQFSQMVQCCLSESLLLVTIHMFALRHY